MRQVARVAQCRYKHHELPQNKVPLPASLRPPVPARRSLLRPLPLPLPLALRLPLPSPPCSAPPPTATTTWPPRPPSQPAVRQCQPSIQPTPAPAPVADLLLVRLSESRLCLFFFLPFPKQSLSLLSHSSKQLLLFFSSCNLSRAGPAAWNPPPSSSPRPRPRPRHATPPRLSAVRI